MIAPTSTINGLKKINPCFYTLANNHIMDQGNEGLYSTINTLQNEGISFSGVGKNLEEASKPFIFVKNKFKLGIYSCAEHEFSIATESKPGANPYDPLFSFDHVNDLKKKCDYVIVLYHGGKEHYRYPSPNLQKTCRRFIDKGADLVVTQHSHCIGCKEEYDDKLIIYGQGNFLFDDDESEFWKTGLLLILDTDTKKMEYISIKKEKNKIRIAKKVSQRKFLMILFIGQIK